jgi:hypothetical protein
MERLKEENQKNQKTLRTNLEQEYHVKFKKWKKEKTILLKEMTIKGLEPQLNSMMKKHDNDKVRDEIVILT